MPTILLMLILFVTMAGCRTTQRVAFDTYPTGAMVLLNGEPRGLTPVEVELTPTSTYAVTLTKEGYYPETLQKVPEPGYVLGPIFSPHPHHGPLSIVLRPIPMGRKE